MYPFCCYVSNCLTHKIVMLEPTSQTCHHCTIRTSNEVRTASSCIPVTSFLHESCILHDKNDYAERYIMDFFEQGSNYNVNGVFYMYIWI